MDITTALVLLLAGASLAQGGHMLHDSYLLRRAIPPEAEEQDAVFLFRDKVLIDTTPAARRLLALSDRPGRSLAAIAALLALRFPALAPALDNDAAPHEEIFPDTAANGHLVLTRWAGFLRITLTTPAEGAAPEGPILHQELAALRAIAEDSPAPIWKEDADGRVNWANRAYLRKALPTLATDAGFTPWPETPLFADLPRPATEGEIHQARASLPAEDGKPAWYEVTRVRRGGQVIGFAQDTSGTVTAEDSRRHLLQTLTKTFAHLTTGLAIFDRQRRLVLFNPAFLDMTGLRVDFLSRRPLVHSVLDRLHDMQMLPEPRHYGSWREQLSALEAAAEQGSYAETWMLPNGLTYRVSGRPHGDGALAFIFEDISDEAALSRQIRAEQEAVQAVLDRLPHALAAFSRGGAMILRNAAYDRLWPTAAKSPSGLATAQLAQEMARWRRASLPHDGWDRLTHALSSGDNLAALPEMIAQTLHGARVQLRATCLSNGLRQVEFLPAPPEAAGSADEPWLANKTRPHSAQEQAQTLLLEDGS